RFPPDEEDPARARRRRADQRSPRRATRGGARLARDPRLARGLPRDAGASIGRGDERRGDRGARRHHRGERAREPASWDEAAQGAARRGGDRMSADDDYLFDPSAPPDAEIERLERALRPLRHRPRTFVAPAPKPSNSRIFMAFSIAAAFAALLV